MQQLGLFDALRRPPIRVSVAANGPVVRDEPDFTFRLKHPRYAWDRAEIEVHRHDDGLWMWSTSFNADMGGNGYRVGAKWGKFAETREDALFYACEELQEKVAGRDTADIFLIRKWVAALKDDARAFQ